MSVGGQPGNNNAGRGSTWNNAIRKALERAQTDPKRAKATLDKIAEKLVDAAANGDEWAIKELGNRIDGKSIQGVIDYTPPPVNPPVFNGINFDRGGPGAQPRPDIPAEPDPESKGS